MIILSEFSKGVLFGFIATVLIPIAFKTPSQIIQDDEKIIRVI